jgi:phosphate transport system protein
MIESESEALEPVRRVRGASPRLVRTAGTSYDEDVALLRKQLLNLCDLVDDRISAGVRAVLTRDRELAARVVEGDRDVDTLELQVDATCRRLLSLRHPASDLRFITGALKIVVDLERMGDLAVNVAERGIELMERPPLHPLPDLTRLWELCQKQVRAAFACFAAADVARAQRTIAGDELVDSRYHTLFTELIGLMMEDPKNIHSGNSLLFVAKHLERLADHAVNVAEMVIYMVKGKEVRHPRSRGLGQTPR